MNLPDNIIRHFLKNVYFISGCACGGKSTISKHLSQKYKMELYDWDGKFSHHKEISDPIYQPGMNKEFSSWEEYFNRPPRPYSEAIRKSINEQVEIAIVELLSLAKNGKIVVDGIFPLPVLEKISSKNRTVFLMAEMDVIRNDFFNRSDKKAMLKCLNGLIDPQKSTEKMFLSIEYSLAKDLEEIKKSGFKWIIRDENTNWECIREEVERHLELI